MLVKCFAQRPGQRKCPMNGWDRCHPSSAQVARRELQLWEGGQKRDMYRCYLRSMEGAPGSQAAGPGMG